MRAGPETYVCVYSAILIIFSFLPCCRRRWLLNMLMHMDAFRALFLDLYSFLALVTYILSLYPHGWTRVFLLTVLSLA